MPTTIITSPTATPAASEVTVRPDLMARLRVATSINPLGTRHSALDTAPLKTERLTLRPLNPTDRTEYTRVLRKSRKHLEEFCPLTNADENGKLLDESPDAIFDRHLALGLAAQQTGKAWRTIAIDSDRRIVGAFNINDITRGLENTGELVFWLAADSLRMGFAEEGVQASIRHAFADLPTGLGLHRLTALIAPTNDACIRLARKVGLTLATDAPPATLKLGTRDVAHNIFQMYAGIELPPSGDAGGVVEGKPSIADGVFGRGLLSILRTEGATPPSNTAP